MELIVTGLNIGDLEELELSEKHVADKIKKLLIGVQKSKRRNMAVLPQKAVRRVLIDDL